MSLSGVCRAVARIVCVGCHSIQTVPDELLHSPRAQMLPPLSQTIAPIWGSHSHFSSPTPWLQVQSCSLFLFLPSFLYLTITWIYIFISSCQRLLPALTCSVRFPTLEDIFLMHLWREMYSYSSSTHSSAILSLTFSF